MSRRAAAGPVAFDAFDRAMQRRFLAKDAVSWLVQAFLGHPLAFEYAARRVASRDDVRATMGLVMGDLVPAARALDPRYLGAVARPVSDAPPDAHRRLWAVSRRRSAASCSAGSSSGSRRAASWTLPGGGIEFGESPTLRSFASSPRRPASSGESGRASRRHRPGRRPAAAGSGCTPSRSSIACGSSGWRAARRARWIDRHVRLVHASRGGGLRLGEMARRVSRRGSPPTRGCDRSRWGRGLMRSEVSVGSMRPPALVFALARDVERWDRLLPHYAQVPGRGACLRSRRPCSSSWRAGRWWRARPRATGHVASAQLERARALVCASSTSRERRGGWTSHGGSSRPGGGAGSRVSIDHDFAPRIPAFAAFVDRFFTRPIAGRTLATFKALAEALATSRDRRARRDSDPPARRIRRHDERRASGSPGSASSPRSAPAATRSGPVCVRGRSPVRRIDRFDPSPFRSQVAAQVDDFDPLAWMPPKTARQLDRFSQFGLVAGRLALDDAGLVPGRRGARRPAADRDLPRLGARRHRLRRGAARALPRARHPPGRAEPRAGRVRRRRAGQPRDRAGRSRADPLDRQLVRVGCRRAR